ncbi:TRAP transporter fused permease subunit [Celeribacter sp. PS-C1]|uniref:TRAP transporter permease n=1 Tax=Celeribacter sp. PS-C1 TaxID=2820813 RepID=UPI001CA5BFA2|nr:TRAP transporter fused permease subunit [Celeribacter sp. PS-C1]MBW6419752.1 TRAP transporter fused permease subunit [Celeribacter sp. PS-C1]
MITLSGIGVVVSPCLWAIDPFDWLRATMIFDQFLAIELALALGFILWVRARNVSASLAAGLHVLAGFVALGAGLFLFHHFSGEAALFIMPTPTLLSVSVVLIAVTLLATLLTSGPMMGLLLLGVLIFGYLAQFFPAPFNAASVDMKRYTVYLVFGGNGFLGRTLGVIAGTVTIYIIFGAVYEISGGTAAIDALARKMSQRGKGMAIKATIVSSGLFGMVSGSASSNVLTSGAFTIQAMRRFGLSGAKAGGIEAVSSTMGQITPPVMGAAAFLMADLTGLSYGNIALAAAIPAVLCYAVMFVQASWLAGRIEVGEGAPRPTAEAGAGEQDLPELAWRDLWHLLPVIVIVTVMFKGDRMTEMAGIGGIAAALLSGWILHGPSELWTRFKDAAHRTSTTTASLVIAGSALGVVLGVLGMTGLDVSLTLGIREIGETSLLLSLLLTALSAMVLGAGMATTGVYIVVGTLLAPGLVALGVPLIAAHLFVLYFGVVSMITPPVAFAALAASGISGASFTKTAWEAMRFGWIIYVLPFVFVYAPELLMVGDPIRIVAGLVGAMTAILAVDRLVAGEARAMSGVAAICVLLSAYALFAPAEDAILSLGAAIFSAFAIVVLKSMDARGAKTAAAAGED